MVKKIVIIGGGISGIYVLRNLLAKKDEVKEVMDLTLVKREKSGWVSVCGLPYALQGLYDIDRTEINKPQFFLDQGVDFRTETEVIEINLKDNKITLKKGEVLRYDYLIIATGRTPSVPAVVEETKLRNIYTFNNEDDARRIESAMNADDVKNAFVRGRGINGLQVAVAFARKGLKTTLFGGPPSLLPSILDPDMGDILKDWLEKKGIRFILEKRSLTLKGDGDRLKYVVVGEEEIPADIAVIATGARPNTKLASNAGIDIGRHGGIVTDKVMRVQMNGLPIKNVYALGDCVEVIDGITHRSRLSQFASTAVVQAKVVTDNILAEMTGRPDLYSSYEQSLNPSVSNIDGLLVGSVGITTKEARMAGIKTVSGKATKLIKARYFPNASSLTLKLIFDAYTTRLIGAQMLGRSTVAERVNELAMAIYAGITAKELRNMERSYDPSLSLLIDVTIDAAELALGIAPVY